MGSQHQILMTGVASSTSVHLIRKAWSHSDLDDSGSDVAAVPPTSE